MSRIDRLRRECGRGGARALRILSASGQLGYGIPEAPFRAGLDRRPDMIGCDMGSIDIGPHYLGSGRMATSPAATLKDLRLVLRGARALDVPLVIGTAGSAGAAPHLEATLRMVRQVAAEENLGFRLASVPADIPPDVLRRMVAEGRVADAPGLGPLTEEAIAASSGLVGQMGAEAFCRALAAGADVVVAGRACDTGIYAALPQMLGHDRGLATHMAKIVECTSLCCDPGGRDAILAELDDTGFSLESMAQHRAATPVSVAAHSLYEQADPYAITEPEGSADLRNVRYTALDARRTRVEGAVWRPAAVPSVKIEGARPVGHRTIFIAAVSDPGFIAQSGAILAALSRQVRDLYAGRDGDYTLRFRDYGRGVLPVAPPGGPDPVELLILAEVLSPDPELAEDVLRSAKQFLLHFGFPGRVSTAGNLAFPFSPAEITMGPAYAFSVYHVATVSELASLFPVRIEDTSSGMRD